MHSKQVDDIFFSHQIHGYLADTFFSLLPKIHKIHLKLQTCVEHINVYMMDDLMEVETVGIDYYVALLR